MVSKDTYRQPELEKHYSNLYIESSKKIKEGDYQLDEMLNDLKNDKRLGITLITRIKGEVQENIEKFLLQVKEIEPNQYYYLNNDLHITVMPLITSHTDFNIQDVPLDEYIQLIEESLTEIGPFNIIFKGITASPSCIMVKGFLEDSTLDRLRNSIRQTFRNSKLENTLDNRYPLITAHSTVIRFKQKLADTDKLLVLLNTFEDTYFGALEVKTLEITCNDWYHRISDTLHTFNLNHKEE